MTYYKKGADYLIGILTLHNATNYGAILQTYALQHKLDLLGLKNEVIAYECPQVTNRHKIRFRWWNPLGYAIKTRTKNRFKTFLEKNIRTSSLVSFSEEIPSYNAVVVGSDQVWNLTITGEDMTYFLNKVPKAAVKCSYAASMGAYTFNNERIQEECLTLLNEFSGISVREKTCKRYLEGCSGNLMKSKKIQVHPDPVLLLGREEWKKFGRCKQKKEYILLYMIWRQPELIHKAQALSKQLNIPVVWISDSLRYYHGIRNKRCCGPEEFVGLFANSTYVVTNSFHGTAFSIIFHKPFCVATLRDGKRIERIADLLEETGLECCSINTQSLALTVEHEKWVAVDHKVNCMVLDAEKYLTHL